jgi:peroxiredoxin
MAATPSTMSPLGIEAPDFKLPDPEGRMIALSDFAGARALLVMFICNHCPFVKHIAHGLADLGNVYQSKGVAVVAINSNDVEKHPDDRPLMMAEEVASRGYTFPYLFDETQETARAYGAACTPDFFVYDQDRKLVYRGQLDDSRPSTDVPVTGADLRAALDAVLEGRPVTGDQKPSIGCNIKWKPGNEPDYFSR